jgi:two-component system OmpR family response regulator
MRLLVVDDDPKFRSFVAAGLEQSGNECEAVPDGGAALERLAQATRPNFDMILLDVMMPVKNGWEFLHDIRERGRETPVIFVTARDSVEERVKGLRLGADDYIIKPFAFEELLARIDSVVRRRKSLAPIELGDLRLDLAHRSVARAGHKVDLSPREFDLLRVLLTQPEKVFSRAELLLEVWGIDFDPGTNVVDVHVARLRRKLERTGASVLQTSRGEGYRIAPLSEWEKQAPRI